MISARLSAFVLGLALATTLPAAELPPPGASACLGCHPVAARSNAPVVSLIAMPAEQIIARMQAWRDGADPSSVMARIAKGFDAEKTVAMAHYFSRQKAK